MLRQFISAVGVLSIVGCSTTENLGEKAHDYNQALDYSVNVTTLANVVRASERRPMTFSRMGSMTYNGSLAGKASPTIDLGGDEGKDFIELEIGGEETGDVAFDALLDQKFFRSALNSITAKEVKAYRDRGWSDRILFPLFIERVAIDPVLLKSVVEPDALKNIERQDKNESTSTNKLIRKYGLKHHDNAVWYEDNKIVFDNDPDRPKRFLTFMHMLGYIGTTYEIELTSSSSYPEVVCRKNGKGKTFKGTNFTETDCKRLKNYAYAYSLKDAPGMDPTQLGDDYRIVRSHVFEKVTPSASVDFKASDGSKPFEACAANTDGDGEASSSSCRVEITFRSPIGMLYFLGELIRAQSEANDTTSTDDAKNYKAYCNANYPVGPAPKASTSDQDNFAFGYRDLCIVREAIDDPIPKENEILFKIQDSSSWVVGVDASQRVRGLYNFGLDDNRYWVSSDETQRGRTMQFIELTNQIFFSNQEASSAPTVSILRGSVVQ